MLVTPRYCFLALVSFVLLLVLTFAVSAQPSDCSRLLAAPWMIPDPSWAPGTDCCTSKWTGVNCTAGRVTQITLSSMGLAGDVPSVWAELSSLLSLFLSGNQLTGTLPVEFDKLTNLTFLDLSSNQLTGTLPIQWKNMHKLGELKLFANRLSGTLPAAWSEMSALYFLFLNSNQFTGTLPVEWSNISTLLSLYIGTNQLTGTIPSSWFSSIEWMMVWSFCNNALSGTLPPIGLMPNLYMIDISSNYFTGPIPRTIMQSPLGIFNAANNALDMPNFLFNCTNCGFVLILSGNRLNGTLPQRISGPTGGVNLAFNAFSGSIPSFIAVSLLDISYNALSGTIPCVHATVPMTLRIDGNNVTQYPSSDCVMLNIAVLSVSNSPLRSIPLNMFSMFPNLTTFVGRNASKSRQAFPLFAPHLLDIVDVSGNDFNDTFSTILARTASYANVAPLRNTLNIINTLNFFPNFTQLAPHMYPFSPYLYVSNVNRYPCDCNSKYILVESTIRGHDVLLEFLYNDGNNQIQYTFTSTDIQGLYQATLFVPDMQRLIQQPEVLWNATIEAMPLLPGGELLFNGLQTIVLLKKITYSLLVTVLLSSCPSPGKPCPILTWPFRYNVTATDCDAALFGVPFTAVCSACPTNAICDGTPYLTTAGGVWRLTDTVLPLIDCGSSKGCSAGSGSTCLDGYTGTFCAVCSPGYGRSFGHCSACDSPTANIVLFVLTAIMFMVLLSYAVVTSLRKKSKSNSTRFAAVKNYAFVVIKVFSNHLSLISPLLATASFGQLHPAASKSTRMQSHFADLSSLQINFVGCLYPTFDAASQLLFIVIAVPSLVLIEMLVTRLTGTPGSVAQVSASVIQLLYMTVVSSAAAVLQYEELKFYDESAYAINSTNSPVLFTLRPLIADPRIDRESSDSGYILGWLALCIGGVGAPLLFVCAFRAQLRVVSPDVLSAKFRFVTSNFKQERWFWEACLACRKALGVMCVTVLFQYPVIQLQVYQLLIAVYIVAHEICRPALSNNMHHAERLSCGSAILFINVLLFGTSLGWTPSVLSTAPIAAAIIGIQLVSAAGLIVALWREIDSQWKTQQLVFEEEHSLQEDFISERTLSAKADNEKIVTGSLVVGAEFQGSTMRI